MWPAYYMYETFHLLQSLCIKEMANLFEFYIAHANGWRSSPLLFFSMSFYNIFSLSVINFLTFFLDQILYKKANFLSQMDAADLKLSSCLF